MRDSCCFIFCSILQTKVTLIILFLTLDLAVLNSVIVFSVRPDRSSRITLSYDRFAGLFAMQNAVRCLVRKRFLIPGRSGCRPDGWRCAEHQRKYAIAPGSKQLSIDPQ